MYSNEMKEGSIKINARQEETPYLQDLKNRLDLLRPDHQALSQALDSLYINKKKHERKAEKWKKGWRRAYHPGAGVEENGFPKVDVLTALDSLCDPFNIFPALDKAIEDKSEDEEYVDVIAKTIKSETGIPVVWGEPGHKHNPEEEDEVLANMIEVGDGEYVYCWASEEGYDLYGNHGGVEELVEDKGPGYSDKRFKSTGKKAIILNRSRIGDPYFIQTPMHELGHTVAEMELGKFGEVYPALYGIETGMSVAKVDVELGAKVIENALELYNWVIYGEVAP